MNQQITLAKIVGRRLCFSVFLLGSFVVPVPLGQHCPHGRMDSAKLAAGMEQTSDPNVILRSAAVAGTAVIQALRRLSKLEMHLGTVAGAAQVSLAKLGDEQAMKELDQELNGKRTFGGPTTAISKLLFVANGKAIKLLTTYIAAHP
jgi:hypothetical protein